MALQTVSTTHELAAKVWSKGLEAEFLKKVSVPHFIGKSSDSLIQHRDNLEKEAGDRDRVGLRLQDSVAPLTSGQAVETNELALRSKYMDITLDEFVHAYRWANVTDRQRVTYEHRDEARAALADLLANAWDTSFFNQIAGNADPGGNATFEGNNTINVPTEHIFAAGKANEAALASTDTFTLDLISEAVQTAKTRSVGTIRPARIPGYSTPLFVCFLHPWQVDSLRTADSRWDKVMHSAMQGGQIGDNPLITGALGVWDGTLLCENNRVPASATAPASGALVRRAILCGAQSAMCVYGRIGGSADRYRWVEKLFDFDREMGVAGGFVAGIKKSQFEDENGGGSKLDFGTVVISTVTSA